MHKFVSVYTQHRPWGGLGQDADADKNPESVDLIDCLIG